MMKLSALTLVIASSVLVTGCATHQGQQEQSGAVIGGVLGGLLGSQVGGGRGTTAAVIAGTLAGAAIGGNIGRTMDEVDRMRMAQALETQPTGSSGNWQNPDNRAAYSVTPTRTFETARGPCRDFTMDAQIDGRTERVVGTACRTADGNWRIQN